MKNLTAKDKKDIEENDKVLNLELDKVKSEIGKLQTPNEKIDWIQRFLKENAFWISKNSTIPDHEFVADKKKNIVDWMQLELSYWQNKQEQATPTIPDQVKKHKSVKMNDLNKPNLNQVQISILFRIMKDSNIISNRDLSKKDFAEIIQTLTGYSENTLRTNFSANQFIEISDRPQDYQEIIDNLYLIIDKLERAKNEIPTSGK
jgi:hypothetical protein